MAQTELTSSATDILLTAIAFISAYSLFRTECQNRALRSRWVRFFLLLGCSCLLGVISHGLIPEGSAYRDILWLVLYPLLFEATRLLAFIALEAASDGKLPTKYLTAPVLAAEGALCVCAAVTAFFVSWNTLVFYLIFAGAAAAVCLICFVRLAIRGSALGRYTALAIALAAVALVLEFTKKGGVHLIWDFDHNGTAHFILSASLILIAVGAKKHISEK